MASQIGMRTAHFFDRREPPKQSVRVAYGSNFRSRQWDIIVPRNSTYVRAFAALIAAGLLLGGCKTLSGPETTLPTAEVQSPLPTPNIDPSNAAASTPAQCEKICAAASSRKYNDQERSFLRNCTEQKLCPPIYLKAPPPPL